MGGRSGLAQLSLESLACRSGRWSLKSPSSPFYELAVPFISRGFVGRPFRFHRTPLALSRPVDSSLTSDTRLRSPYAGLSLARYLFRLCLPCHAALSRLFLLVCLCLSTAARLALTLSFPAVLANQCFPSIRARSSVNLCRLPTLQSGSGTVFSPLGVPALPDTPVPRFCSRLFLLPRSAPCLAEGEALSTLCRTRQFARRCLFGAWACPECIG